MASLGKTIFNSRLELKKGTTGDTGEERGSQSRGHSTPLSLLAPSSSTRCAKKPKKPIFEMGCLLSFTIHHKLGFLSRSKDAHLLS